MHNPNQQNQNPFDKLASEMVLEIFNTCNKNQRSILTPKDMTSVALSCKRFNSLSGNANCIFSPHKYKKVRKKASDYHAYKEKKINQLRNEQKLQHEKNASFFWNKTIRNVVACGMGVLLASILAFKLDMYYSNFLLTSFFFSLIALLVKEFLEDYSKGPLDRSRVRKIPHQFFEDEIAFQEVSLNL